MPTLDLPPVSPTSLTDPINARILTVSEDRLQGFSPDPFGDLATLCELPVDVVLTRLRALQGAGVIRRVRQTLLATNLAKGALVAWKVPAEKLSDAFDALFANDPFSGHVVLRSTDGETPGSVYKLWTTLKVPQGYSLEKHAAWWATQIGAESVKLMSAKRLFTLGVGHLRRRELEIGAKSDVYGPVLDTNIVSLSELDWQVLVALKRELTSEEIVREVWQRRADEANLGFSTFCAIAQSLNERGVVGRFSTFLEHVKPSATGERATRYNALFHWKVPVGRELDAGREVGRFECMTHAYWREGGEEFANVNIMGVAHGSGQRAGSRQQSRHRRAFERDRHSRELYERLLGRQKRDKAQRDRAASLFSVDGERRLGPGKHAGVARRHKIPVAQGQNAITGSAVSSLSDASTSGVKSAPTTRPSAPHSSAICTRRPRSRGASPSSITI